MVASATSQPKRRDHHLPIRVLHNPPHFRPTKPAWSRYFIIFWPVENSNYARWIAMGAFRDTPYAQITIGSLRRKHIRLLLRRGAMPGERTYGGRCTGCAKRMQDCKRRLQRSDKNRAIEVSWTWSARVLTTACNTYPIAKVRQSAPGARAVIGSNIVLAEMCSTVEGSKSITFPCELPVQQGQPWAAPQLH